jgi:hypothetical protein
MRLTPGVGDVSGGAEGGVGPVAVFLLPMLGNSIFVTDSVVNVYREIG